jgi:hypothetical protein
MLSLVLRKKRNFKLDMGMGMIFLIKDICSGLKSVTPRLHRSLKVWEWWCVM